MIHCCSVYSYTCNHYHRMVVYTIFIHMRNYFHSWGVFGSIYYQTFFGMFWKIMYKCNDWLWTFLVAIVAQVGEILLRFNFNFSKHVSPYQLAKTVWFQLLSHQTQILVRNIRVHWKRLQTLNTNPKNYYFWRP